MIAVFCKTQRELDNTDFYPRTNFIRIESIMDIRGKVFTGVIILGYFQMPPKMYEAYLYMKSKYTDFKM